MQDRLLLLSLATAGMCLGCGNHPAPSPVFAASPLHGGILIPLPEDQGYVELLNDKSVPRGRVAHTTIVAYVLQPDQKSPVAQQVQSVIVKLGAPPDAQMVALHPDPDRSDPVGRARFVSDLGRYLLNQSGGEVQVMLGGKTLTVPFRGPR